MQRNLEKLDKAYSGEMLGLLILHAHEKAINFSEKFRDIEINPTYVTQSALKQLDEVCTLSELLLELFPCQKEWSTQDELYQISIKNSEEQRKKRKFSTKTLGSLENFMNEFMESNNLL